MDNELLIIKNMIAGLEACRTLARQKSEHIFRYEIPNVENEEEALALVRDAFAQKRRIEELVKEIFSLEEAQKKRAELKDEAHHT